MVGVGRYFLEQVAENGGGGGGGGKRQRWGDKKKGGGERWMPPSPAVVGFVEAVSHQHAARAGSLRSAARRYVVTRFPISVLQSGPAVHTRG